LHHPAKIFPVKDPFIKNKSRRVCPFASGAGIMKGSAYKLRAAAGAFLKNQCGVKEVAA